MEQVTGWRKLQRSERPYNAYERGRYIEKDCDHNGPYCRCDAPAWLREPTAAEVARWPISRQAEISAVLEASEATERDVIRGEHDAD